MHLSNASFLQIGFLARKNLCWREELVTSIFLLKNLATPPRAVALRLSSLLYTLRVLGRRLELPWNFFRLLLRQVRLPISPPQQYILLVKHYYFNKYNTSLQF